MSVQLWAPSIAAEPLVASLREARLAVTELAELEQRREDQPLLLAYTDPVGLLEAYPPTFSAGADPGTISPAAAGGDVYAELLEAIKQLEEASLPWRLVNLACLSSAAVVAWCVQPHTPSPPLEVVVGFPHPEALDALVARHWLEREPEGLARYLSLERHPRSAALDHRPPDDACLERLVDASSPAALATVRRRRLELVAELDRADERLQELQRAQLENQGLRDQLVSLELERSSQAGRIQSLEDRCTDLELNLQLSQDDLAQLSRRTALLEELVKQGAAATSCAQGFLAQALRA